MVQSSSQADSQSASQ